jgi:hypothetical protein
MVDNITTRGTLINDTTSWRRILGRLQGTSPGADRDMRRGRQGRRREKKDKPDVAMSFSEALMPQKFT